MRVGQIIRIDSPRAQVTGQPQIQERVEPIAGRYLNRAGTDAEQLVHARQLMQRRHPGFLTLLWVYRRTMTNYECCIQYIQRDNPLWTTNEPNPPRVTTKTHTFTFEYITNHFQRDGLQFDGLFEEQHSGTLRVAMAILVRQADSDFIAIDNMFIDPQNLTVSVSYRAIARGLEVSEDEIVSSGRQQIINGTLFVNGQAVGTIRDLTIGEAVDVANDSQVPEENPIPNSVITKPKENKTNRIKLEDENGSPRPNREHLLPDD